VAWNLAKIGKGCLMKDNLLPFVSIIIPAYNEARYIKSCLESLKRVDYPSQSYEIIVVDNGSSDETVLIAKSYTENVLIIPNVNVSSLRNFGASKAKGEVYAFIDADCIADEQWLQAGVKALTREPCVVGSVCDVPSDATWIEKAWFAQKIRGTHEATHINSANMIVRSELFNKLGGFNNKLIAGEDYEFCMRAKREAKIISDDKIKVVHLKNPSSISQFLKREIWHGLGAFESLKSNSLDKAFIGTLLFIFLTSQQLAGLALWTWNGWNKLFVYSSIGIGILLLGTLFYRLKYISGFVQGVNLLILYYLFYLGRSISLLYLITKRKYSRVK
jgi:glycosyltransferase involved in cell wall biosynthesis